MSSNTSADDPNKEWSLKVKSVDEVTPSIKRFELVSPDGSALPPFTAGSHIEVFTSNRLYRSYSLVNAQGDAERYVIAVKLIPGSTEGSQYMHDFVDVDEVLTVRGPLNHFPLDESAKRSILLAGGIGITPLMSMARRLASLGADFTLHYLARSVAEMAFKDEILKEFPEHAIFFNTREDSVRPDIASLVPSFVPGTHLYVCGPRGMIDAARAQAAQWPPDAVHYELFINTSGVRAPIKEPAEEFEIVLARSGEVLTVPRDETILEVLIEHGIKIPCACRVGICGTCAVPLLGGEADHRDFVLTPEERTNRLQVCCSRAKPGERLVLDR